VPIAKVTCVLLSPVTKLLFTSCTCTDIEDIDAPATVFVGCTVKTNLVADPGVILNVLEVALVNPALVAPKVYPVPVLLMDKLLKVATPATAAIVAVPDNVPAPGFVPIAMATEAVDAVRLSLASNIRTVIAGLIAEPATALLGCWPNTSLVAVPGVILKVLDVAPVNTPLVASNV
jgi:hypothetical protein